MPAVLLLHLRVLNKEDQGRILSCVGEPVEPPRIHPPRAPPDWPEVDQTLTLDGDLNQDAGDWEFDQTILGRFLLERIDRVKPLLRHFPFTDKIGVYTIEGVSTRKDGVSSNIPTF